MEFEIVTHCLHYAKLLGFQLSSLVLHPPTEGHSVTYTLCFTAGDRETVRVVQYFSEQRVPGITWNWVCMPERALNRRAIGRNQAALATRADWVWFADADYCFGPECFAALADQTRTQTGPLLYPRRVIATSIEGGDVLLKEIESTPAIRRVPERYWNDFVEFRFAVGGVQIVRGETCRELGYVRDLPKWQREANSWQGCREDVVFRHCLGTRGRGIDLQPVYRIRHSAKGRYDPTVRL